MIPNSNEVNIYKYEQSVSDWTILDNLDQHGLLVTGIDWAPNTNRIVTCSAVSIIYVASVFSSHFDIALCIVINIFLLIMTGS